ncbi:hypothetical protein ACLEX4_22460 [Pseudescherichia vulneris]
MKTEQVVTASIPELVALIVGAEQSQGTEPDNAERSALAAEVLCYFANRTGQTRNGDPVDTIMVDLVTDLLHLCGSMDIDFNGVLAVAAMHHGDECCS